MDGIGLQDLPGSVRQLAKLIGIPAFMKLVDHFGGRTIYFSANPRPNNKIAQLIGIEAFRKAAQHVGPGYSGGKFWVPLLSSMKRKHTHKQIVAAKNSGASESELAKRYRMTDSGIRRIIRKSRAE